MVTPIVSVDELATALEKTLRDNLAATVATLGLKLDSVKEWQQLPTAAALATARFPAVAISSPGLTEPPTYSQSDRAWHAVWRIGVGIYDRGKNHHDTQAHIRNWCAAIRLTARAHRSLGGLARDTRWAGEEYALLPGREQSRTIGAAAVAFDIHALVSDTYGAPPAVATTPTTLSVR